MGVPALFRWLSKKYPKIIYQVVEEEEKKVAGGDGANVTIPVDISSPNPNSVEFDNLYLDMNGIVHPCTHPEGKPAPETEAEMMVEVFKYTERVVNMVRPRRLLFMAIDGVAPRAKMNQQRSRRFRSAQEAKEKEAARKESVALWEAMGKTLSEEERNKKAWDSNAITPGTPFMELLASSLRYWIVQKINTDPGWKKIQVILSDASVPGEGEHKIMDFIRRQRSNPGHDPNTRHVIYGLDADLIMLSLATHEPNFKVLREDVFFQSGSATACRICGQEGHFAAQCTGVKAEMTKKVVSDEKKPFIFLDIAILREYLEVELNVPTSFPFNLEQAIDDWVLLIFFVGNDFLPHLPSLEIREGAIDTLLKIWKQQLSRMGGYLTNHGQIELSRAQIILEGLAQREDEIFQRRREAEERQNQNAKRRKLMAADTGGAAGPSPTLQLTAAPVAPPPAPVHPSLPPKPVYDFVSTADSIGLGAPQTAQSIQHVPVAVQALAGSNRDVVANRRAIRLANMSAAEMLRAELGVSPVLHGAAPTQKQPERDLSLPPKPPPAVTAPSLPLPPSVEAVPMSDAFQAGSAGTEVPGLPSSVLATSSSMSIIPPVEGIGEDTHLDAGSHHETPPVDVDSDGALMTAEARDFDRESSHEETGPGHEGIEPASEHVEPSNDEAEPIAGSKRKLEEVDLGDLASDDEAQPADDAYALKVNPDGTVEQEDTVKLWEPGYKQRYYRHKFNIDATDEEFKTKLIKCYVEGLAWVLRYYYQGAPSWHWYYPYHFAPFAADFKEINKTDIDFDIGQPFKPFEQLMAVFPTASRKHIPSAFQPLMVKEDSPIIDFYPLTFQIDMNGKRMAWQGVALLPFIDEKRLLDAMAPEYPKLTEDEVRRNRWGNNVMFVSDQHQLYPSFEPLYGKKKRVEPARLSPTQSGGINGSVLPDPQCLPGSTYDSPLPTQGLLDIPNDRSLSVIYLFPKQLSPHRSILLNGVKRPNRVLRLADLDRVGTGARPGYGNGHASMRGSDRHNGSPNRYAARGPPSYAAPSPYDDRGYGGYGGYGGGPRGDTPYDSRPPPRQPPPMHTYGAYGGGPPPYNASSSRGGPSRGAPPATRGRGGYGGYGGYGSAGGYGRDRPDTYTYGTSTYGPPSRGRARGW